MTEVTRLDATNTTTPLPIPEGAECRGCGYALRGLTVARCPECGQAFDPAERGTMRLGVELSRLGRACLAPPGWIMNGGFVILSLLMIIAAAPPGLYFGLLLLTAMGWRLLGAGWGLRLLVAAGLTDPAAAQQRRWSGLYRVHSSTLFPGGGGRFLVADSGFFDTNGFAYAPDAQPPVIGQDFYDPLDGGWWLWRESMW